MPRSVTAANGEAERYLFDRGVGKLKSPLLVRAMPKFAAAGPQPIRRTGRRFQARKILKPNVGPLWLVDVRAGGACAFTTLDGVDVSQGDQKVLANFSAWFERPTTR